MQRPRLLVQTCALALAVLASGCGGLGTGPAIGAEAQALADSFDSRDRSIDLARLFDAVVETVEASFFDKALLRELDWRRRAAGVRASIITASSTDNAVRRINALIAELKTSHCALLTPDEYQYYAVLDIVGAGVDGVELIARRFWGAGPYYPGIGAFTQLVDGHHFVDGILEGSPAEQAGLNFGDEILTIDGKPYSPVAAFRGKVGTSAMLEIRRRPDAEPQRLAVPVVPIRPVVAFPAATAASARVIERGGLRIGYVHVWSLHESTSLKTALARLEPHNQSKPGSSARTAWSDGGVPAEDGAPIPGPLDSLIVDLRGRVGGRIAVAAQNLDLLDARQRPEWDRWHLADGSGLAQFGSVRPGNPSFRGRSALLVDDHTRSAAEVMAQSYKRNRFGAVLGSTTAGAGVSGALFVMPGDLLLYVAVAKHESNGQPIEGIGVSPDYPVARPLPYAGNADPVLDAALDLLPAQAAR